MIKQLEQEGRHIPVEDMAASFQSAVVDVLLSKTLAAARQFGVNEIIVAGGVSANKALRSAFINQKEFKVRIPPFSLCTDNAAMIAAAGYYRFVHERVDGLDMDVLPNWPLS
jgi:N6-L-threonylcarbamoyladenine synthase